jgi:DNA-binding XRE family transcriptional regulator
MIVREKIKGLEELRERGLCIIDEDEITVENRILKILKEKELLLSDLAKLTGIPRQNISAVVKKKMKPGIDFALKVSYVLGIPVEEVFSLTEDAWVRPYKHKDTTLYLDIVNMEIIDNVRKRELIKENGYEYVNFETNEFLTREEYDKKLKQFLKQHTPSKMKELEEEYPELSTVKLTSLAKEELRKEFSEQYVKIFKKLGEKIQPYVINSKKVGVSHEESGAKI